MLHIIGTFCSTCIVREVQVQGGLLRCQIGKINLIQEGKNQS